MATQLKGASRGTAYSFIGEEIANLRVSPQLVRWQEIDDEWVEHIARGIAEHGGLYDPVTVRRVSGNIPELIDGRHRREAVLRINEDPVKYGLPASTPSGDPTQIPLKAFYTDLTDTQAIKAALAQNSGLPLSPIDLAHVVNRLSNAGWEMTDIAVELSTPHRPVSKTRVYQLKSLIQLPEDVQMKVHKGELAEHTARETLSLDLPPEEIQELAEKVVKGEVKGREVASKANKKRRESGKRIKRNLNEIKEVLEELGTSRSMDFLEWINGGSTVTMKDVERIFADD